MKKIRENKHSIIKAVIAIVVIPLVAIFVARTTHILEVAHFFYIVIVIGTSYLSTTIYDWIVLREPAQTIEQIAENSLDIKIIKEDVKKLQESVHKQDIEVIRERNARRAMRREADNKLDTGDKSDGTKED